MSPWELRQLAYDKRDRALFLKEEARSYRAEGRLRLCSVNAWKALEAWHKYRQFLRDAQELAR